MLYPVLHRLEREGLIVSTWKQAETGRRRKYYQLNRSGTAALEAERLQWYSVHETLNRVWGKQKQCLT
jgi:DNA-binding PadR family transcriptional regulator